MEQKQVIEIKNVTKIFGDIKVLDDVSLTCEEGSITGIMGRNGSGKSVLLKCICSFLKQTSGDIFIYGKQNTEFIKKTHRVGALIEAPAFLAGYSGFKNLELLYCVLNKRDKKHILEIMKRVGLNPDFKKVVQKYSMGMKQRLAIAQAIMENQEIIILDEPMNGLDIKGVETVRELLLDLKKEKKTILLTTHNAEDIDKICDHVYEMRDGKIFKGRFSS